MHNVVPDGAEVHVQGELHPQPRHQAVRQEISFRQPGRNLLEFRSSKFAEYLNHYSPLFCNCSILKKEQF